MRELGVGKGVVYLASRPKQNFQSLANAPSFGEIRYVFEQWNANDLFLNSYDRHFRLVEHILQDFDPDHDYFVPIGDVTTTVVCVAYLAQLCRGRFMVLIWNPKIRMYEQLEVDVGDFDDDEDGEDDGDGGAEDVRGDRTPGAAR